MLLQNVFLKSQAPAVSSALGAWQRKGASRAGREPRSLVCSSIAQVDISSHEVSSPKPSPFSHSQKLVAGSGGMGN